MGNRMEQLLFPGRNTWLPRDPEFSGIWRLESFDELASDQFFINIKQYMCLQDKRALCRLKIHGKKVEEDPLSSEEESIYDYYNDDEFDDLQYEVEDIGEAEIN